jgi:hypothetical protein
MRNLTVFETALSEEEIALSKIINQVEKRKSNLGLKKFQIGSLIPSDYWG